ncbi:MAG TPA: hypothetical protein VL866_06170, partial [Pyrinomonadaceae bacterium]|nr:hypothetical protein [Pyrinomonadaceae bacterium]
TASVRNVVSLWLLTTELNGQSVGLVLEAAKLLITGARFFVSDSCFAGPLVWIANDPANSITTNVDIRFI